MLDNTVAVIGNALITYEFIHRHRRYQTNFGQVF